MHATTRNDDCLAMKSLWFSIFSACVLCGFSCAPSAPPQHLAAAKKPDVSTALQYEVTPREGGALLSVIAEIPASLPAQFHVDPNVNAWIKNVELAHLGETLAPTYNGETWDLTACKEGCRVTYDVDLAGAAKAMDDVGYAAQHGDAYLAPPSTWLLHPASDVASVPYRFHVTEDRDVELVTGVFPTGGAAEKSYGADLSDLPESPYSIVGKFQRERQTPANSNIEIAIVNGSLENSNEPLLQWIRESAHAVSAYYGTFPVKHAAIIVLIEEGAGVGYATTLGNGGAAIVARIGRETPPQAILRSWMMTHEMLHLAFPNLPRQYRWLEEGMATYIEPIARARLGALTEEDVWRGLLKGLFFARPLPGEGGLDESSSWGRTYWGGALYCFLADLRIRKQTQNRFSLDDALRGILQAGGNVGARFELEQVLRAGDSATGTTVLRDLHQEMGPLPMDVDLIPIWAELGIENKAGKLVFNDSAPLSHVRKAITSLSSNPLSQEH